jgi:drug/metabolite transporter (DMT)-like permease
MENKKKPLSGTSLGITLAFIAALLSGVFTPFTKLLLNYLPLYLAGGIAYSASSLGCLTIFAIRRIFFTRGKKEDLIQGKDWILIVCTFLVDGLCLFSFYYGLPYASSESASLLGATELVLTAIIASIFLHEHFSWPMWIAIALMTVGTVFLALDPSSSGGSSDFRWIFILLAYLGWAIQNNFTARLSNRDPFEVTGLKCIGSGMTLMIISLATGERSAAWGYMGYDVLLGIFASGISISCYVLGERFLGAGKTSAIYSSNPLIGVVLAFILFHSAPAWNFYAALATMAVGLGLAIFVMLKDEKDKQKKLAQEASLKTEQPPEKES